MNIMVSGKTESPFTSWVGSFEWHLFFELPCPSYIFVQWWSPREVRWPLCISGDVDLFISVRVFSRSKHLTDQNLLCPARLTLDLVLSSVEPDWFVTWHRRVRSIIQSPKLTAQRRVSTDEQGASGKTSAMAYLKLHLLYSKVKSFFFLRQWQGYCPLMFCRNRNRGPWQTMRVPELWLPQRKHGESHHCDGKESAKSPHATVR